MKSNNKIYSFFIALALLFWNPISYHFIYGNKQIFSEKINFMFYLMYSVLFLVGLLLIYLIGKNKFNEKLNKIIFIVTFTGILFSALVMIDGLIGLISMKEPSQVQKGLIFEPNSQARYQTIEFDYIAKINSLGLRDREINVEKGDKFRVLCFGDSFTFGWGVDIENSWPQKLEQFFHEKGYNNVEVINCGQGGQYTTTYKKYMSRVVPLLKPDLVLIGILQQDDLSQLYENNYELSFSTSKINIHYLINKATSTANRYIKYSFHNILTLVGAETSKPVDIKSSWKNSFNTMIGGFNKLQLLRFYTLKDTVQKLFKSGNLNPSLLRYYIDFPNKAIIFNNPNHPATIFSIKEMDEDVKEMKAICQENKCGLIFINLPSSGYTGHTVIRTPGDFLKMHFEKNNKIDSIYNSIATSNGLPYIQLTEYFL